MDGSNAANDRRHVIEPQVSTWPDQAVNRSRAEAIVDRLTREEKLSLVISYCPLISPRREELGMVMGSGFTSAIPRLGIPALAMADASLGVANVLGSRPGETATALPSALSMASSFSPELVWEASAMIGAEARARRFNVLLAGGINLIRDPWAGRNFEYFSEDTLLSGVLGGAAIDGVQSNKIASTAKHYILNSQETGRMTVDARIGLTELRESDLLTFQIAIERGRPASVMTAYNRVNGDYASESSLLINDILKGELAYPGWVMSDWGAVHSTEEAVLAGLDQESGIELDERLNGDVFFTDRLKQAIEDGRVPAARLDEMVTRILFGLISSGAFDHPVPDDTDASANEDNMLAAQRAAEAGIVLLRNEGSALPIGSDVRRILIVGGNADVGVMSGGGSSQVRSHGGVPIEISLESGDASWFCRTTYHASSPLAAIRAAMPHIEVGYCTGDDRVEVLGAVSEADMVVVFATQWRSEAIDLETLSLPDGQDDLIAAIAKVAEKTVVVLQTGGAVLMPWLTDVSAVVAAWYPGQRGGEAIARVLSGEVNPSGRLPITFPAADGDAPRPLPCGLDELRARDEAVAAGDQAARIATFRAEYREGANIGYRWHELKQREPLFPFGFGLSYTRFEYSGLTVKNSADPTVAVTVTNTGDRAGTDVVQVYVRAIDGEGAMTWRLAGFHCVALERGQSHSLEIELEPRTFARWDQTSAAWSLEDVYRLAIGRSAQDLDLETTLRIRH